MLASSPRPPRLRLRSRLPRFLGRDAGTARGEAAPKGVTTRGRTPRFTLENRSGYDTEDLRRFFAKGLAATHTRARGKKPLRVIVVASPIRTRGCAEVGHAPCDGPRCNKAKNGSKMAIAIAAPWRFSLRRLGRLLEHEAAHIRGFEHGDMPKNLLLSLGPTPKWAEGTKLRYHGRAPNQLPFLRKRSRTP